MCCGLLDGKWEDYLVPKREREHYEAIVLNLLYQKGHKDIFRFSFFPSTITEWNKLPKEIVTIQSLSIFKSKLL